MFLFVERAKNYILALFSSVMLPPPHVLFFLFFHPLAYAAIVRSVLPPFIVGSFVRVVEIFIV